MGLDIRIPLGVMFTLLGLLLTGFVGSVASPSGSATLWLAGVEDVHAACAGEADVNMAVARTASSAASMGDRERTVLLSVC